MKFKGISHCRLLLVPLALIALAHLPMCSNSSTTPLPDSIDPGDGGQISLEMPEVRFYPQDGRANVVTTTDIELYFSVDMDENCDWKVVVAVYPEGTANPVPEGTVPEVYVTYDRYSLSGVTWQRRALAIMPADAFDQGHTVRVDAIGFTSLQGVSMPEKSATFTIVQYAYPVVTVTPADKATGVTPTTAVKLDFNLPVEKSGWAVTINEVPYSTGEWSGNTLTINPPGYFSRGEKVSVATTGFKTVFGSMPFPDASTYFTIGSDAHSISWGDAEPLSITAPLWLHFDSDVNLDCGSFDPNCGWVVDLDGVQYTKDSPVPADIQWALPRELNINHKTTGIYLQRGGQTARVKGFYDTDGYPFGNGIDPVEVAYDVKLIPSMTYDFSAKGPTGISTNTNVILYFDEPVKYDCGWTVNIPGNAYGENDPGTSWNATRTQLTIDPPDFTQGVEVQMNATGFKAEDDAPFNDLLNIKFTPSIIPVTGVTLSASNLRIVKGRTASLTAIFTPSNATYQTVTWTKTDPLVATVSEGNPATVTAVEKGTSVITVTTDDGSFKASCRVVVVTPHFVAVGDGGLIIDSIDNGITWTPKSPPAGDWLHHIAQGKGRYVAVGNNGRRLVSVDNGINWNDVNDAYRGDPKFSLHHIVYTGTEFIAVGGSGAFMRSTDGITWSYATISANDLTALAFSASGELVAVGGWVILQSTDWGVTWGSPISAAFTHDITYGNKFVAVVSDDFYKPIWSDHGTTWNNSSVCDAGALHGIAFGNNTYVAVGVKGRIISSSNGDTWSQNVPAGSDTVDDLRGIAYGNGVFVAVGGSWRITRSTVSNLNTWVDEFKGTCGDDTKTYCHYRGVGYGEDEPGDAPYFIVGGEPITVNEPVPNGTICPVGVDDNGDTNSDGLQDTLPTVTITHSYVVAETEVTYRQWKEVYDWATDPARGTDRYYFANQGWKGCGEVTTDLHPVTAIDWRDAMIWCNALTEYCNKDNVTKVECVYCVDAGCTVPQRNSWKNGAYSASFDSSPGGMDNPYVNVTAGGYRLLTSEEWELAARWRNDDNGNTVAGYSDPWFTKGNSASGAYTSYNDIADVNPANGFYDNKDADDLVAVYGLYYAGTGNIATGVSSTAAVKSKQPNSLGIYDMSGNVWEWIYNYSPFSGLENKRMRRSGGWGHSSIHLQVGDHYWGSEVPWDVSGYVGFRVARTLADQ